MAQRNKNMLEAFQASKNAPDQAAAPSVVRAKMSSNSEDPPLDAGGPFAAVPLESEEAPSIELSVEGLAMQQKLRWLGMGIGALICFGLGQMFGSPRNVQYAYVKEVQAAERPQDLVEIEAPTEATAEVQSREPEPSNLAQTASERPSAPSNTGGPYDHPLQDPKNRVTIRVEAYDYSDENLLRAWSLADYLVSRGFDARPTSKGDFIYVVVGASPTRALLQNILTQIKELPGPPPGSNAREYADAFLVNIPDIL